MSISSVNGVASTVSRYRFVAAGGETSLTGSDANGATLSYLAGKEEVYLNGALLVRGQDYTGTDGATISSLTALVAGDTVEIITFVPFAIPTAISSATVTTQGDLIVATGASAVTRLGVGTSGQYLGSNGTTPTWGTPTDATKIPLSTVTAKGDLIAATASGAVSKLGVGTNGQVLTAASGQTTGLQWATVSTTPASATTKVATFEQTTSTTYADLTTPQSVTLTTGTKVLVIVSAQISGVNGTQNFMSYAISGATTLAADDSWALYVQTTAAADTTANIHASSVSYQTVTAGSNTFTAKFKRSAVDNGKFSNREITVIDLGS